MSRYGNISKGKYSIENETEELYEKLNQVTSQMANMEGRIVNLTRLMKLLQTNSELYEQELQKISTNINEVKDHPDNSLHLDNNVDFNANIRWSLKKGLLNWKKFKLAILTKLQYRPI